jgi:hypothetical protein
MITELKSVRDVWKKMPTERHARLFLEKAIWGDDRFCPHCGPKRRRLRPLSLRCSASHGFRDAILSFTLDEYPAGCIRRRARQPPRSRQATAPVPKATSLAAGKPEAPVRPDNTSDAAPACDG